MTADGGVLPCHYSCRRQALSGVYSFMSFPSVECYSYTLLNHAPHHVFLICAPPVSSLQPLLFKMGQPWEQVSLALSFSQCSGLDFLAKVRSRGVSCSWPFATPVLSSLLSPCSRGGVYWKARRSVNYGVGENIDRYDPDWSVL